MQDSETTSERASLESIDVNTKDGKQQPVDQSVPKTRTSGTWKYLHKIRRIQNDAATALLDQRRAIVALVIGIIAIAPFSFGLRPSIQQTNPLNIDLKIQNHFDPEIKCSVELETEGKGVLVLMFPHGETEFDFSINRSSSNVSFYDQNAQRIRSPEGSCADEKCESFPEHRRYFGTVSAGQSKVKIELTDLATKTRQGYRIVFGLDVSINENADDANNNFILDLTTQYELSMAESFPQPQHVHYTHRALSEQVGEENSLIRYDYGQLDSGTLAKWELYDSEQIEREENWTILVSVLLGIGISLIGGEVIKVLKSIFRNRKEVK